MKKELEQKIEIPEGVEVKIEGNLVNVKGPEGEISKKLDFKDLEIKNENNEIILGHKKATKKEKKILNTLSAHLRNLIKGVKEKFEYKLKVCFSHFPFTVEIKENEAIVKNFLGEKIPRKVNIPKGADVQIKGQDITVSALNIEIAGQVAANFEKATKIKGRDRRVFQDGIFITNKAGREI